MKSIDITTTFEYDELGRVIVLRDTGYMTKFTYGSTGNVYCHQFKLDTETTEKYKYYKTYSGYKTVRPEYDELGRVSILVFPSKSQQLRVEYSYNENNVVDSIREVHVYKRLKREVVSNDIKFIFDDLGRIVEQRKTCDNGCTYYTYYSYIDDSDVVRHYITTENNLAEYSKQAWFDEYGNPICTIKADSGEVECFEYKYSKTSSYISTERHVMRIPPTNIQFEKIMNARVRQKHEESGDE